MSAAPPTCWRFARTAFPRTRDLLTRALGIGKNWLSVSTIASAGSAINWAKEQFFPDHDWPKFQKLAMSLARRGERTRKKAVKHPAGSALCFDPYLAGDRMSIEQKQAAFTGLTLATTREQMLAAMLESLAAASAARLTLLQKTRHAHSPRTWSSPAARENSQPSSTATGRENGHSSRKRKRRCGVCRCLSQRGDLCDTKRPSSSHMHQRIGAMDQIFPDRAHEFGGRGQGPRHLVEQP